MENRSLFTIDDDGNLVINKIEARDITEFRKILQRDKGSEGDYDGKKKFQAFKEFMYIYLIADPGSTYRDLPIDERKDKAKKRAKLSEDWKEDALIKESILVYIDTLKLSGIEHAYYNASRGLYSIGEDLELFNKANDRTRKKISKLELEIEDGEFTPDEIERKQLEMDRLTENLSKNTQEIVKLSNSLPSAYKGLEDLYTKMRKEQESDKRLYGGGELGNREE